MSHLIRIIVLGMFAAAGVAVAIGLAVSPPAALVEGLASLSSAPHKALARDPEQAASEITPGASFALDEPPSPTPAAYRPQSPRSVTPTAQEPTVSLLAPMLPVVAPYQPPVAQQIEELEETVREQGQTLEQFNDLLPNMTEMAADLARQAAALAPPAPAPAPEQEAGNELPVPADATSPRGNGLAQVRREGDHALEINVQDADIREVLDLLSRQGALNILASESVQGTVSASLTGVDVMTALDAILRSNGYVSRREGPFVFVGLPQDFVDMDMASDRVGTRIYRPNYVTAAELESLIIPLLTQHVGTVSLSYSALQGIPADSTTTGGNDFANSEVLVVRDYEGVLAQVDQIVQEVDTRPLQVSIQSMILSVKLDDSLEFGVDFSLLSSNGNARVISGSPLSSLASMSLDQAGLKVGFIDGNVAAFLNALETVGDTNVIASPRLMCLNKQRAEILIGSQLGYVSTTVTENAATQSVEFLEVGTQLRLRPFISADGMIRMEVHPELSTGNVRIEEGFTLPDKELTQVTTNIMCRDGATMVIGGLIREDLSTNTSQIPLLGSLPLVGVGFRQKKEDNDRREIIVLITPRIVFPEFAECEGESASCEFHQRQAIYADKMSPIGRRYHGRRYTRLGQAAWQVGNARAALRYANLAVHFDPLSRDALELRSQVIASSPYGDRTVDSHLHEGLAPWQHPLGGHRYHNWVIEEPYETPPPVLPENYDPGMPTPTYPLEKVDPGWVEPLPQVDGTQGP